MTRRPARWQERDPQFSAEQGRYREPIPSRKLILDELRAADEPLDAASLARRLGIRKRALIGALDKRLGAMVRDRQVRRQRGRFAPVKDLGEVSGVVSAHRDGYGWLTPQDGSKDLHIDAREMREVMHGDRVRARVVADDGRGRRSGVVLEVLEHGTRELVGRFEDAGEVGFVIPEDPRFKQRLVIARERWGSARHGDLVVARILDRAGAGGRDGAWTPLAEVDRIVDTRSAADLAAELAIVTHELPREWPEAVLAEARRLGETVRAEDHSGREDLRELPLVTIDGEDARDFDDAVYCEPARGGWRLVVAIADVSHYVPAGDTLDREAAARATSVYFPDRVLPMLPEALSNELCSLKPEVERLALVCDMRVNEAGEAKRARFYPAVIRSAARLTYTQVAAMLIGKDLELRARYAALVAHLENLHAVYRALQRARVRRGALDFDAPEVKVRLTPEGSVAALDVHARNDAHRLIEECMIAANIEAARFLKRRRLTCLFRVHGEPEERRITELQRMLRALGVGVRFPEKIGTRELEQVVKLIAGRPDAAFIETLLIRSLPQALYQPVNIGHFGLGLAEYTHFTSPIRRYPDLLVHRAIRHELGAASRRGHGRGKGRAAGYSYSMQDMERLGAECSARERRADVAAREVMAYLKCDYMRAHVGDEFEAVITSVVDFGMFVQLANLQVDGLVHVSDLSGDYYTLDQARCAWVGKRTRTAYQLGQRVAVRLKHVNMTERQLDFVMASEPPAPTDEVGRRARRRRSRGHR